MIATFSIETAGREVVGQHALYRNRVLFRAGEYPEHKLSLSVAEMGAAARGFKPIAGNIEHTDFLKGQACFVDAIRVDDADPTLLRGDVRIPLWLDEGLGDREKKVSAEWHKPTKTLAGLALCVHPAIAEADLMACFAKASSREGRNVMQMIHDHAASAGAYCVDPPDDTKNRNASFIMRHERSGLQKIHDHAVEHGAACHGASAYFAAKTPPPKKGKPMGLWTKLTNLIAGAPDDNKLTDEEVKAIFTQIDNDSKGIAPVVEPPVVKEPETADFSKNPAFIRVQADNAKLSARLLTTDAEAWADSEIKAERALAPERDSMIALFVQARIDDEGDSQLAKFSVTSKALGGNRSEMLKAIFAKRPRHGLYREFLPADTSEGAPTLLVVDPAKSTFSKAKADPDEMKLLRGHTTLLSQTKKS